MRELIEGQELLALFEGYYKGDVKRFDDLPPMPNKSGNTAITRKGISVPMKYLDKNGLLVGRKLDYGSGRGFDADAFGMERFDPNHFPTMPQGKFDTITSNYVLNVVHPSQVDKLVADIKKRLNKGGKAYISVRRDIKAEGYTKSGTFQHNVELTLPLETKKSGSFAMYRLEK